MQNYKDYLDVELVNLSIKGDELAFTELYNRYNSLVYSICVKEVGKDNADEVFGKIWEEVIKEFKSGKVIKHFTTWIMIVARNTCINLRKKNTVKVSDSEDISDKSKDKKGKTKINRINRFESIEKYDNFIAYSTPEDDYMKKEKEERIRAKIREALLVMKDKVCRESLLMRFYGNLHDKEIADRFKKNIDWVVNNRRKNIKHLRESGIITKEFLEE